MPEDAGFYIDDVCIPQSSHPVEAGRNAQIAVTYDAVFDIVAIDSGNFCVEDLGVAIVDAISKQYQRLITLRSEQNT